MRPLGPDGRSQPTKSQAESPLLKWTLFIRALTAAGNRCKSKGTFPDSSLLHGQERCFLPGLSCLHPQTSRENTLSGSGPGGMAEDMLSWSTRKAAAIYLFGRHSSRPKNGGNLSSQLHLSAAQMATISLAFSSALLQSQEHLS